MEQAQQLIAEMKIMVKGNATAVKMLKEKKEEFEKIIHITAFKTNKKLTLDFYPISIKILNSGKELRKVVADKSHSFYLTSGDIVLNVPGFSKPTVIIEIQGRSTIENFGVELDGLPCTLSLNLDWDSKLVHPSQDIGEITDAVGVYDKSTKHYIVEDYDTLKAIANRFDINVAAIMDKNNMSSKNIQKGDELIIPDNTFKASSPDHYEIHSAYYTKKLEDMLSSGKDPLDVMTELKRLQEVGYKDNDSKEWGQKKYGTSEGEAISEDYRNPEGEVSIHGYTNAEDGEPIRFCLHQSLAIDGVLPNKNGNVVYWEIELPKSKESTIMERVKNIGGPGWRQSGPYWVFTGKIAEDEANYDDFFPMAKKVGFTLVAIFSCGAAVYVGETFAIVVATANLIFTIDDDFGNSEESLIEQYLPEELEDAYNAGKVTVTIIGGKITFTSILENGPDVIKVLSLTKGIYGTVDKTNKIIAK